MCIEFFNSSREKQDNYGSPAQLLIIGEMGQKMTPLLPTVILSECASLNFFFDCSPNILPGRRLI